MSDFGRFTPTHLHRKTGEPYQLVRVVTDATTARSGGEAVLYRNKDDRWFVQDRSEFDDGRFAGLDPPMIPRTREWV